MFAIHLTFIWMPIVLSNVLHLLASELNTVKIIFYYGPTYYNHQRYDLDKVASILEHPQFGHNQTNMYMHAYGESQNSYSVHSIVNSYLKGNSINLLTIEWTALAKQSYISAQHNVLKLAPEVAKAILALFDAGLDRESFHLVGHSLGATGVGVIGREVIKQSNGEVQLYRLTSLDPANPEIHREFILPDVSKKDAEFVHIIHSDAGGRGINKSLGHADFWPNGGKALQNGCPWKWINPRCSHLKSNAYWAQSVARVNQDQLLAYSASSYDDFLENGPAVDTAVLMGVDSPTNASGDYYLQIDSDYGTIPIVELLT